ncbi:unnamed protein product [Caenorhabditis sp. 36 PRJEB53466]|nr:unnamed protein product [Caenorhabditis sp. 36 PRJEB53466]
MNGTSNQTTVSVNIEKKLAEINETLASISAKEVLFIITLSFLAMFAAVNMCLLILERRKKKKQNLVPQAIVIQPNNTKSEKGGRSDRTKMSTTYEKDVLPSKSMKMKVAISPSMSTAKKVRVAPKETVSEDSQISKTESEKTASKRSSTTDLTTAVEPMPSSSLSALPAAPAPTVPSSSAAPIASADKSQPNDSMTSFTVQEEVSNRTKNVSLALGPKDPAPPSTPTATTLSGTSSTAPLESSHSKSADLSTAKEPVPANSPATPVRTPETSAAPIAPIIAKTPPPNNEKKI